MSASNNLEAAANAVVEDMANDVKGVLGTMDLAANPQIKALRQRVEAKLAIARELAAEKASSPPRKPRKRPAPPTPTPTTSLGRSRPVPWLSACWSACSLASATDSSEKNASRTVEGG